MGSLPQQTESEVRFGVDAMYVVTDKLVASTIARDAPEGIGEDAAEETSMTAMDVAMSTFRIFMGSNGARDE